MENCTTALSVGELEVREVLQMTCSFTCCVTNLQYIQPNLYETSKYVSCWNKAVQLRLNSALPY